MEPVIEDRRNASTGHVISGMVVSLPSSDCHEVHLHLAEYI
jgi:hypothetical protein